MPEREVKRAAVWREVLWSPLVGVVGAVFAVLSGWAFLRDEFLPERYHAKWPVLLLLPHWSWRTWAICGLAVLILFVLEGCYRLVRADTTRANAEITSVNEQLATANANIQTLRAQLEAAEPKVLVEHIPQVVLSEVPLRVVPGFMLRNVGESEALNVQVNDISNEDFVARFQPITQIRKGSPILVIAEVEQSGEVHLIVRHEINRLFLAGWTDFNVELKPFRLRVTYNDIHGQAFETVYEMMYHYFKKHLTLRLIRWGRVEANKTVHT